MSRTRGVKKKKKAKLQGRKNESAVKPAAVLSKPKPKAKTKTPSKATAKAQPKPAKGKASRTAEKAKPGKKQARLEKKRSRRPDRAARGKRSRDERDDEDDGEPRGRFGPPPAKGNATLVMAIVGCLLIVVLLGAMASGGGSSLVDEHEAEKAYEYVESQYSLAKGGDALTENRAQLRNAFQKVVDAYPNTEFAEKANARVHELQ
jgi:hypothetical protein